MRDYLEEQGRVESFAWDWSWFTMYKTYSVNPSELIPYEYSIYYADQSTFCLTERDDFLPMAFNGCENEERYSQSHFPNTPYFQSILTYGKFSL